MLLQRLHCRRLHAAPDRERIATSYRMILQQALKSVEVRMGDVDRAKYIYAHPWLR